MLTNKDIKNIISSLKENKELISSKDIAFCILLDFFENKDTAYSIIYGDNNNTIENFLQSPKIKKLRISLKPFGIGVIDENDVSREQNKAEILKMLQKIDTWGMKGEIEPDKYAKLVLDYRAKLQDKFDMENEQQQRIIIVPQKHDIICPHSHRECTYMPTKEVCMKFYNLKETASVK